MGDCCGNNNIEMFVPPVTTTPECKNILKELIDIASANIKVNGSTLAAEMTSVLTGGLLALNKGDYCCPDCTGADSFYFLGGYDALNDLAININLWTSYGDVFACCVNSHSNATNGQDINGFLTTIGGANYECCESNFQEAVNSVIQLYPGVSSTINTGVVEMSAFDNKSLIDQIGVWIKEANQYITPEEIAAVYGVILTSGVVIKCNDCKILISTAGLAPSFIQSLMV
jgi:hypothetical protein